MNRRKTLSIFSGIIVFLVTLMLCLAPMLVILNLILSSQDGEIYKGNAIAIITFSLYIISLLLIIYGCAKLSVKTTKKMINGELNLTEKAMLEVTLLAGLILLVTVIFSDNPSVNLGQVVGWMIMIFLPFSFIYYGVRFIRRLISRRVDTR